MKQYPLLHADRGNLLIHLLTVPIFIAGVFTTVLGGWQGEPLIASAGLLAVALAILAQRFGHSREAKPPPPFTGPLNFLVRIFREQFVTFPLFVLSGGWWRNWRAAGTGA